MMLWHTDNVQFHTLYGFLQNHYSALLCVIYKFDHYLEMMLYKHLARCGAQLSPAVKAEDVKALSFPSTIDGTSTQGGLLGQDVVLMDDIDGLRDSPSIVTFSHVSDIEQPACPQDTLSELTTASQLPDASSYTDDVFCIYIQDICPGAVVDYFALRETLLSSSGGDSGEGALVGTAADGESRANVIRKSNNNYYDIKGVTYVPSVVCFPLKPKPHELVEDAWVQQHWQGVQGGGES